MANCHHLRVPLQTFLASLTLFLSCIVCMTAISPRANSTSSLVPSSSLQPLYHFQRQLDKEEQQIHHPCHNPLCPGAASLQGRRPYQEDRVLSSPNLRFSLQATGHSSLSLHAGLFGVFDGHLGESASDFVARSIRERFLYHSFEVLQAAAPSVNLSSIVQSLPLFESALLAAISDIDSSFGEIALHHEIKSGSTACIALQVGNRILVANVGDSKAFFCSSCDGRELESAEKLPDSDIKRATAVRASRRARHHRISKDEPFYSPSQGLCARKLSSDHRPDRLDEKLRIEAYGGFVSNGSLPRVNGQLAVSRSIGDVDLKKYGVISEPELSGWLQVSDEDKFLILASDGIFEKLSPQEVCHVVHAIRSGQDIQAVIEKREGEGYGVIALPGAVSSSNLDQEVGHLLESGPHSASTHMALKENHLSMSMPFFEGSSGVAQVLAQILVELAFRAGSMDNLSAVVVPLKAVEG